MRKNRWFAVIYMFLVTAFFSSIIISLSIATRERVKINEELALEQAVLEVIPGLYDDGMGNAALHRRFQEHITLPSEETGGAWAYRTDNGIEAYAVPIAGQGFWAPIKGVIGVKSDLQTVTGIAFYEQSETPGLGAVIVTDDWRSQFEDKLLAKNETALKMKRPGESTRENEVNAVTGATQTSVRVAKLINDSVGEWRTKVK
jgi:Na+-transporting NADH:ubiquinone oxidoreductase subunit C